MSPRIDRQLVADLYAEKGTAAAVHRELAARGIQAHYGTIRRLVTGEQDNRKGRDTTSRFANRPINTRIVRLPAVDNPALAGKKSLYPHTVVSDLSLRPILKEGQHSPKIGGKILKGKWKGMPVYTLTLEERATCPTSCGHWQSCYGNAMHFAVRHDHTAPDFEERLVRNVVRLGRQYPRGFVVRLHVLGDFFSVRYVALWAALLEQVPALNVFGYSARWDDADPIAVALIKLTIAQWERFAMRFSDAPVDECSMVSLEHPIQRPADAIWCPEQSGKTESCASCALCWHSKRRIAFVTH